MVQFLQFVLFLFCPSFALLNLLPGTDGWI
jgi:hypothetical protein